MSRWLQRDVHRGLASYSAWRGILFLLCILATAGSSRAADGKLRLILSTEPVKTAPKEPSTGVWLLRPNVQQEVLTTVQNDDPSQPATVIVQLRSGGIEVAKSPKIKVDKELVPVAWAPPTGAAAGNAPVLSELKSPVEVRLLNADGDKELQSIRLEISRPSEYLEEPVVKFFRAKDGTKNRLFAVVKPRRNFRGPQCRVELVLDPSRIPGFDPGKRSFVYPGYVSRPLGDADEDAAAYLVAEDVSLREDTRKGMITIRADGYDRAFLFDTTFAHTTNAVSDKATRIGDPILRINTAPMADSRKPVHVSLEADNVASPDGKRLVLDMVTRLNHGGDEGVKEHFTRLAEFSGDRSKRFFGAPGGPNNGLLFKPKVEYWNTDLHFEGIRGKVTLRLRLFDDKAVAQTILDIDTDKWDPVKEIRKTIILDDTAPEGVRIDGITKPVRGNPFRVRARATDDESEIREVIFFVGRPQADGKAPAQAIPVVGKKGSQPETWEAELLVPADQRGPLEVSARFTNGVGLSRTEVLVLREVAEPPPPAGAVAVKPGSIAGIVTEGDRPQRDLPVDLTDAAGKVLLSTKTDDKGAFIFKNLGPGAYRLASLKTASNTLAKTRDTITLAAGENKTGIVLKLYRQQ